MPDIQNPSQHVADIMAKPHTREGRAEADALQAARDAAIRTPWEEALRVALRYIDTDTCGAPVGTIRSLHTMIERRAREPGPGGEGGE